MEVEPIIEHLKISDNIMVVPAGTSYSDLYEPKKKENGTENKERT